MPNPALRDLPRVDHLAEAAAEGTPLPPDHPLVRAMARDALAEARGRLAATGGHAPTLPDLAQAIRMGIEALLRPALTPVLNATGVVLHTNLGRAPQAPLPPSASGYVALEYDLERGSRGSRSALLTPTLTALTGAEDALITNNATAALMLAVATLAGGRRVVVARGELVEIGGSFRLPEVLEAAGVTLHEVGTTNRVHLDDYARALSDESVGAVLRVYPSNYKVVGFTTAPPIAALTDLARARSVPLIVDLGSDPLTPLADPTLRDKPSARELIAAGVDAVLFSGDKELGGPQAGLTVGTRAALGPMRRHPWMRAMRVDKLRLAALDEALRAHLRGEPEHLPTWRALHVSVASLSARAEAMADALRREHPGPFEVVPTVDAVGGGAHPESPLPGAGLTIGHPHPAALARALRLGDPPVIALTRAESVLLALRAIDPRDDARLIAAIKRSLDTAPPAR